MATALHRYQHPQARLTLREGIAEYHAGHRGLATAGDLAPPAAAFLRCHDAVHVVYGCGDALDDEAVVKIATVFGTTGGLRALRGYRLHESFAIYRRLAPRDVLRTALHAVVLVPRTVWRCLRQRRRWPWDGFETHLDTPLVTLRAHYGISVAHADERAPRHGHDTATR
jgi:hypothetical protein